MVEVPHSLEAIRVSQHFANVFIEAARHSSHAPESHEEELALVIYDVAPVFSARFEVSGCSPCLHQQGVLLEACLLHVSRAYIS